MIATQSDPARGLRLAGRAPLGRPAAARAPPGTGQHKEGAWVLSMVLAYAVSDGPLAVNPAAGVSPRVQAADKRFLSHRQAHELGDACGEEYRLLVLFLAYTGFRWGEMAALRVGRVDFLRRRVLVSESVTPVKGVMTIELRRDTK